MRMRESSGADILIMVTVQNTLAFSTDVLGAKPKLF